MIINKRIISKKQNKTIIKINSHFIKKNNILIGRKIHIFIIDNNIIDHLTKIEMQKIIYIIKLFIIKENQNFILNIYQKLNFYRNNRNNK